jgi:hypothetical protein
MWKIGTVVSVTEGWSFNIADERDRPLVAFAYETHGEAEVAARHVQAAVEKALAVRCREDETRAPTRTPMTLGNMRELARKRKSTNNRLQLGSSISSRAAPLTFHGCRSRR